MFSRYMFDNAPRDVGMTPDNKLIFNLSEVKFLSWPNSDGIVPFSWFCRKDRYCSDDNSRNDEGIVLDSSLLPNSIDCADVKFPSTAGIDPCRLQYSKFKPITSQLASQVIPYQS